MSNIWDDIAGTLALRGEESGAVLERYRVKRSRPLVLDQIDGNEVLEEGDPDLSLSDGFRQYRATYGLPNGTVVRVLNEGDGWLAVDVESDTRVKRLADDDDVQDRLERLAASLRDEMEDAIAAAISRAFAAAPVWSRPAVYSNNWGEYQFATEDRFRVGYWKDPLGCVFLKGLIQRFVATWVTGEVIFNLPAGYRPDTDLLFTMNGSGSALTVVRCDVRVNGDVTFNGVYANAATWTATNWVSLDSIRFPASR